MLSLYQVFQCQSKFDDVEDWVQSAHGGWEMESVCTVPNFPDYGKWSKSFVGEFLGRSGCLDITGI